MATDTCVFDSSDSVRSAVPLKYAQYVTFQEPLALEEGGCLPVVRVAYRDLWHAQPGRRQCRPDLPCPVGRFARRPARCGRHGRLVGPGRRAGQVDRHRPLLRHLPQPAGRLPRHDRAQQHQSGNGQALWGRFPHHHRPRHGQGPEAAGRASGHPPAAGRGGRIAGRTTGPDLGHAIARDGGRHRGPGHLAAADQPGHGLRRRRPQRHPSRPGLPGRSVLRQRSGAVGRPVDRAACWATSPISRARR